MNRGAGNPESFHGRYLACVAEIERDFPVAGWKSRDAELWPLARMALYLDLYWAQAQAARPQMRSPALRFAGRVAQPFRNLWKSRRDLAHRLSSPRPSHAVFLGDGTSLDRVDGAWRDRFGEPLIEALEAGGRSSFLMQGGYLNRLPWHRPTFSANVIESRAFVRAALSATPAAALPGHDEVLALLGRHGIAAPSLARVSLERSAGILCATATAFERLLRVVRPALAFVVNYYSGLGPAFMLACRRLGILSIDLQHCPQDGLHMAYGWSALPPRGYATLPAVFWTWTQDDADHVNSWAGNLADPWHRGFHGGHTQLLALRDDGKLRALLAETPYEREILVALQPVHGQRRRWAELAAQIASAPRSWRWWIRRHPAAHSSQDAEYDCLLSLRMPNVIVAEASTLPLPALLRHMSAMVSLSSGAAAEAAMFGVPALFLTEEARVQFAPLIERGHAAVVPVDALVAHLTQNPATRALGRPPPVRALPASLAQLDDIAAEYSRLWRRAGNSPP